VRLSLPALALATILAGACSPAADTPIAQGDTPDFDPITFFDGHTHSWGVIEDRSGAPTGQIVTDSHGDLDATGRLRMVQHLSFHDGTTQQRDWTLWRNGQNRFEATANDMVGTAVGEVSGRIFHWQWVLARSPGNPLMNVTMNQWMYRMQDSSVTIRTTVSKLGLILAEVTEQFTHPEQG
jgi:hypothetical protein